MKCPKTRYAGKTGRKVVAFHVTAETKAGRKELAQSVRARNLQNEFEEFLMSKAKLDGLSELKKTYLSLREQEIQLGKALGKDRMLVLVNAYKKVGGDVKDLSNRRVACGRMLKEWCPKQPEVGHDVSDVVQFEAYLEVNKKRLEAERELLGHPTGS